MSAYIQFFIRNGEAFLPISIYSHGNALYHYFDEYTPWEKIKVVTRPLLNKIREDVNEDILYHQKRYDRAKEMKEYVATMNNSMDEKMEWVENIEATLSDCCEEIKKAEYVKHYLNFLDDIVESVEYEENIDYKNYLYVGIEVGNPTVDDIVRQYMKVLISRGFGAGWSSWNDPRMAFDERLIRAFECGISEEDMKELCVECGYVDVNGDPPYMGGFKQLEVVDIPSGELFQIMEYDGSEYIEYFDESDWYLAEGEYYPV